MDMIRLLYKALIAECKNAINTLKLCFLELSAGLWERFSRLSSWQNQHSAASIRILLLWLLKVYVRDITPISCIPQTNMLTKDPQQVLKISDTFLEQSHSRI